MKHNPHIHYRRSIRMRGYDYSQEGLYFITICVKNRECLLGTIIEGKMAVNEFGSIVENVWNNLPNHYPNIELGEFVIMPNHIHGIIAIVPARNNVSAENIVPAGFKPASTPLSEIIRALKTFSARQINEKRNMQGTSVWQRNYWEHIIRDNRSHQNISNYIKNNPQKWAKNNLNE